MVLFSLFPGVLQFPVPFLLDERLPAFELVPWSDKADGAVQSDRVVVLHKARDQTSGILDRERRTRTDRGVFDGTVPALYLSVALGIIGRGPHVGHAADADELLEITGDELRSVIRDDPGPCRRKTFTGSLEDDLHIRFCHPFPDFPVNDEPAGPIHDRTEIVKRSVDVYIGYVHMPVFVGGKGLDESGSFL